MADTIKKYLGQEALGQLITEIKAADAATLQSAKDYCDAKDSKFESAGAGATAEANAKAYTDEKVAPLATTAKVTEVEGKVTAEETRAKAEEARIVGLVEAVDGKADANAQAISAINDGTNGILAQAKADAKSKADAVQAEVDALEELVGVLPEGTTAKDVVDYVNIKTAGIATDAALGELQNQLSGVQGEVATIKGDYLKASDKEELAGAIASEAETARAAEKANADAIKAISDDYLKAADKTELAEAISAEAGRADAAEKANAAAIKAISDDYLKAEDKTELQGGIDENADAIAAVKADVDAFFKDADMTEAAKETLKDIQTYITEHTSEAADMVSEIEKNAKAIADHAATNHDFVSADATLKSELTTEIGKKADSSVVEGIGTRVGTLESEMDAVEGRATDLEGRMTTVEGAVATKAEAQALADAVQALEGADAGQVERIEALEALFEDGEGSIADQISEAVEAVKEEAAADATEKANTAEANAKAEAARLDGLMNARVELLEAVDHEHANKELLDTYTQTEANLADAVAKKHSHANASVLDGITAEQVTAWDAAEGNAKTYADGLNTAMTTKVDALEDVVETKAAASDLEDAVDRIDANEDAIAANKAAHEANAAAIAKFQPYTADEVSALFLG